VASLKAGLTNYVETATLKNGTGGGAPVLSEVAPYLTVNTQKRSRRLFWQKASAAALDVDFLLAGSTVLDAGGIAGHFPIGGVGIATYTMRYQTGAYVPGGVWTDVPGRIAVAVGSAMDSVASFSSQITANSLRYSLTSVPSVFTLASFVALKHDYDLEGLWSNLAREKHTAQFEDSSIGEDAIINFTGSDREVWSISWDDILLSLFNKLEAIRACRKAFWVMDKLGAGMEFTVSGGRMAWAHRLEYAADSLRRGVAMEWKQVV